MANEDTSDRQPVYNFVETVLGVQFVKERWGQGWPTPNSSSLGEKAKKKIENKRTNI